MSSSASVTQRQSSRWSFNCSIENDVAQSVDVSSQEPARLDSMKAKLLAIHADVERDRAATKSAIDNQQSEILFRELE